MRRQRRLAGPGQPLEEGEEPRRALEIAELAVGVDDLDEERELAGADGVVGARGPDLDRLAPARRAEEDEHHPVLDGLALARVPGDGAAVLELAEEDVGVAGAHGAGGLDHLALLARAEAGREDLADSGEEDRQAVLLVGERAPGPELEEGRQEHEPDEAEERDGAGELGERAGVARAVAEVRGAAGEAAVDEEQPGVGPLRRAGATQVDQPDVHRQDGDGKVEESSTRFDGL